jgi:thiosulfate dehydrogenase
MPLGATYEKPQLTNEEAWDVAAYINSKPHPEKFFAGDWPKLSTKPVDYPFGPYTDKFSEKEHKFGPFVAIQEAKKK